MCPVFQSAWDSVRPWISRPRYAGVHLARSPVGPLTPGFTWPGLSRPSYTGVDLSRSSVGPVTPEFTYPVVQSAQLHRSSLGPWFSPPSCTGVNLAPVSVRPVTPGFSGSFSPPSYPESVRRLGVHLAGVQTAQLHRGSLGPVFGRARYTGVHPAGVQSAKEPRGSVGPVISRPRYTGVHLSRGPGGPV